MVDLDVCVFVWLHDGGVPLSNEGAANAMKRISVRTHVAYRKKKNNNNN